MLIFGIYEIFVKYENYHFHIIKKKKFKNIFFIYFAIILIRL